MNSYDNLKNISTRAKALLLKGYKTIITSLAKKKNSSN